MKFLSLLSSKLQQKLKLQSSESQPFPSNEDIISPALPHGLLAIGTFGDVGNAINGIDDPSPVKETEDLSLEQVCKLEEELAEVFPLEKLIKCRHLNEKDEVTEIRRNSLKRSISFLVKKVFICGSGVAPPLSLPTPLPLNLGDSLQDSRMKKILKTLLHKKIYPQNSSQMRRYITEKETTKEER